jgi:hypothetical protein
VWCYYNLENGMTEKERPYMFYDDGGGGGVYVIRPDLFR